MIRMVEAQESADKECMGHDFKCLEMLREP